MSGPNREALARAARRSIIIALLIIGPVFALGAYEFWFVNPGEGYLNSDQIEPVPAERKLPFFLHDSMVIAAEFVALAGLLFVVQALFIRLPR